MSIWDNYELWLIVRTFLNWNRSVFAVAITYDETVLTAKCFEAQLAVGLSARFGSFGDFQDGVGTFQVIKPICGKVSGK